MIHRNEIGKYLTSLGLTGKGVEVGTFKGDYAKHILSTWGGTLYMVDPWREIPEGYIDSSNHANHPTAYLDTMNKLKGVEDRGIMIRALSEQAVDLFKDESLDFVYIDGNHTYDYVKQDIELWYPKVKKGGLVAGHDYLLFADYSKPPFAENGIDKHIYSNNGNPDTPMRYAGEFGVNPAVDEFSKSFNYKVNLTTEQFATWYFIK